MASAFKLLTAAFALPALAMARAVPEPVNAEIDTRIVGGVEASRGDIPFIVSTYVISEESHWCGGSLLDESTVLTAAHCFDNIDASDILVRAGSLHWASGGKQVEVAEVINHPEYDNVTTNFDISILKLADPIKAQCSHGGISYATLVEEDFVPEAGTLMLAAGWGVTGEDNSTTPDVMMKVEVPIVDFDECSDAYSADGGNELTEYMFCAGEVNGGEDTCQGDSGGPLVDAETKTLVGVVSFGRGCGIPGFAGVYASVGTLWKWIDENR